MKARTVILVLLAIAAFAFQGSMAFAQPVLVTTSIDTNRLAPGASTTLRVYAQVAPEHRAAASQIFSWYIDLVVFPSNVVELAHSTLARPTSDRSLFTSSAGIPDGLNVRGIHDTFLARTNAGVSEPIELLSVQIKAISHGTATVAVQAGTGVEILAEDFLVETLDADLPLIGGNYTLAANELRVIAPLTNVLATVSQTSLPENRGRLITVRFPVIEGNNYAVEYSEDAALTWQRLANAPHNNGHADDTNSAPVRFYRVKVTDSAAPP